MMCRWIKLIATAAFTTNHQGPHYYNMMGGHDLNSVSVTSFLPRQVVVHKENNVNQVRKRSSTTSDTSTQLRIQPARRRWQYTRSTDVDNSQPRRPYGRFITSIFRFLLSHFTKFIMTRMNKTYLHDDNNNLRYLFDREDDIGVLTICNHQTVADDPGIWVGTIPLKKLTLDTMRTIMMTEEWYYCFGKFSANIFRGLNCVPIRRGDLRGLQNPSLKEMHSRLNGIAASKGQNKNNNKKEWAHLMIEGRLYQSWRFQKGKPKLGKFRLGAAKLIACSPPKKLIVLPVYHQGMDDIFPEEKPEGWNPEKNSRIAGKTKSYFPKKGKRVDVYIGDPIDFTDVVPENGLDFGKDTEASLLETINNRLYEGMLKLDSFARDGS